MPAKAFWVLLSLSTLVNHNILSPAWLVSAKEEDAHLAKRVYRMTTAVPGVRIGAAAAAITSVSRHSRLAFFPLPK